MPDHDDGSTRSGAEDDDQDKRRRQVVDGLSRPIRGGTVNPRDLSLAEGLLLTSLLTDVGSDGVIGPTQEWAVSVAKFEYDRQMKGAWESLYEAGVLRPHRSSPTSAFVWDGDTCVSPIWQLVRWYVARGRAGDDASESATVTYDAVSQLLRGEWPERWVVEVQELAPGIITAEGMAYFVAALRRQGLPAPRDLVLEKLEDAMCDAGTDFSLGQIVYLAWKPLADIADHGERGWTNTKRSAVTSAVNRFAKRGPRFRAQGWAVEIYNAPITTFSLVITCLFDALGKDILADSAFGLVEAAFNRADPDARQWFDYDDRRERIRRGDPLPAGAWDAILQTLDAAAQPVVFEDSGWPQMIKDDGQSDPLKAYYENYQAMNEALLTSAADYLRRADSAQLDTRAQLVAKCHAGALDTALTIVGSQYNGKDVENKAELVAAELEDCIEDAYKRAEAGVAAEATDPRKSDSSPQG